MASEVAQASSATCRRSTTARPAPAASVAASRPSSPIPRSSPRRASPGSSRRARNRCAAHARRSRRAGRDGHLRRRGSGARSRRRWTRQRPQRLSSCSSVARVRRHGRTCSSPRSKRELRANLFPSLAGVPVEVDPWDDVVWAVGAATPCPSGHVHGRLDERQTTNSIRARIGASPRGLGGGRLTFARRRPANGGAQKAAVSILRLREVRKMHCPQVRHFRRRGSRGSGACRRRPRAPGRARSEQGDHDHLLARVRDERLGPELQRLDEDRDPALREAQSRDQGRPRTPVPTTTTSQQKLMTSVAGGTAARSSSDPTSPGCPELREARCACAARPG